jgi:uncharacterized protein YndB with AHSA1/START domain
MEVVDTVGAVAREVRTVERAGRPAKVVVASRTYDADRSDLWDALTNAERLPRWFLPVSGDLRLGGRYQFQGNAGGIVEQCEEPALIAVTWEYDGGISWVVVRLHETPGGTTLVLEHTVFVDGHWAEYGPGAVGVGWDMALYGLAQHLTGVVPEEVQTWLDSPAGRDFITTASVEWGRANEAGGEDPEAAAAAAVRTTAAYTAAPGSG